MKKPKLAYTIESDGGEFVARCPILHISEYGKTRSKALENLALLEAETIEIEKELGNKIPTYEESLRVLDSIARGGRRENAGRKPKLAEERRNRRITIYVSKSEFERITKSAKSANFPSASMYMRKLAIG